MEQADLILTFTGPLDALGIRYMATGAVASTLYGVPRFTHDLDLVLELPHGRAHDLENAYPLTAFYCPPAEIMRMESHRPLRGHFNIIQHATGFKADVFLIGHDPLHLWAIEQRRHIQISPDHGVWIAPPEYVILRKLEYFRDGTSQKHLDDIRGMLDVSGNLIDHRLIADWTERLHLQNEWKRAEESQ